VPGCSVSATIRSFSAKAPTTTTLNSGDNLYPAGCL
jgi:hypothetical protein